MRFILPATRLLLIQQLVRPTREKHHRFVLLVLWEENPPDEGGTPHKAASNAENASMPWHHHVFIQIHLKILHGSWTIQLALTFYGTPEFKVSSRSSSGICFVMKKLYICPEARSASMKWYQCMQWVQSTWRSRQNRRHFPVDIFEFIFVNVKLNILFQMSLWCVPNGPINKNL